MSGQYVRLHKEGETAKGFTAVTFPKTEKNPAGTYDVYEPLATEMRRLISIGQVHRAYTLLCWFDEDGFTYAT